mmetsp:Transcript_9874/g.32577  ORF Transcript_9874/g.32577 Transcript_9874/m.32577 type:complete len:133 (-) Transcript_9874:223-621(-)
MGSGIGVDRLVSSESEKPADARDLETLTLAVAELSRLRARLGHLAEANGFVDAVQVDCTDVVLGDHEGDFLRCKAQVVHIRACLRLSTQKSIRRARARPRPTRPDGTEFAESFFDRFDDDPATSEASEDTFG